MGTTNQTDLMSATWKEEILPDNAATACIQSADSTYDMVVFVTNEISATTINTSI